MGIGESIRFVANEIAWYQVSNGLIDRKEMAEMAVGIIECHGLGIGPEDFEWLEGVIMQYTHEMKREWRLAR